MNRDRAKELLPIFTAFANGEAVEYKKHSGKCWHVGAHTLSFDAHGCEYRIKPKEPREWWVCWDGDDPHPDNTRHFPFPDFYKSSVENWDHHIKVREIIE